MFLAFIQHIAVCISLHKHLCILQLARELNSRDVTTDMKDDWSKIAPKIITIAEDEMEDNVHMRNFLACYK